MTVWNCLFRIYRLLLRAYPREFRERYADEMIRTFRDRGREIARAEGVWGLLRYTVFTGKDWFQTVLRERMDSMHIPSVLTLRWVFLSCIALDLVLLTQLATPATGPVPLPFALLLMYGVLVLWATTNTDTGRELALRTGTFLGLLGWVITAVWTLAGVSFLPSTGIAPVFVASTSMAILFVCSSVAGYRAARQTTASSGWVAGCWCGVVCALVEVTCELLVRTTLLPGHNLGPVLTAAGHHLLEGAVMGALLGALAGFAAKIQSSVKAHAKA